MGKDKNDCSEENLKDEKLSEEKANAEDMQDETLDQAEKNKQTEKNEDEESEKINSEDNDINAMKKLKDENKRLNNELDTLKDRLARTVAEYDNYRKRTAKEKEGIYTDACEDVLKLMLPVHDNLERALAAEGNIEDLKKGVDMTVKQFNDSLEKLGVEEISIEGGFDPNFHNAVMHVDDENYEKNVVVEVFQKGYKRGERVLRHSMVKVAN
ncbi:heat shock protein GrpE [Clostridium liquoris]|jgi:molecular chaperone GrpE|uniref:Protein GrpE n=1 Tax=Clostridium liquoris TaxID=1289519 RepID=A0A2T0B0W4_9CLOT|nr:nucleotide exchange factor GrpE [Clostridium liquoris]PRR77250.1 heat shock protein GrpE [Clostridium liquoris]